MSAHEQVADGGSAFPIAPHLDREGGADSFWTQYPERGMTVRDYFAIHADQPGQAEVVAEAGLTYSSGQVWAGPHTSLGSFNDWWQGLEQQVRFDLYARVRYRMADAMLRARTQQVSA